MMISSQLTIWISCETNQISYEDCARGNLRRIFFWSKAHGSLRL